MVPQPIWTYVSTILNFCRWEHLENRPYIFSIDFWRKLLSFIQLWMVFYRPGHPGSIFQKAKQFWKPLENLCWFRFWRSLIIGYKKVSIEKWVFCIKSHKSLNKGWNSSDEITLGVWPNSLILKIMALAMIQIWTQVCLQSIKKDNDVIFNFLTVHDLDIWRLNLN